jgi:polyhydroxybutyrate depolymerase
VEGGIAPTTQGLPSWQPGAYDPVMLRLVVPLASAVLALALVLSGCQRRGVDCQRRAPTAGEEAVCQVPGWRDRDYILQLPASYDPGRRYPLILALHGGGGDKEGANPLTCEDGDEASANCLAQVAGREGFIIAFPDGTANALGFRTWNQGGEGDDTLQCPHACEQGIDDVAYVSALLDDIEAVASVDPRRIYATGFSNGAGMSHRLACELGDRLAAVAPVSGANQFAGAATCAPGRPVPILAIHGRTDPCWPYDGGAGTCLEVQEGNYVAVEPSMIGDADAPGWALRNGCDPAPISTPLADTVDDGTSATLTSFSGCAAETALITVEGAGHTWPGGDQYLKVETIGGLSRDFSASERIVAFFAEQALP